jgi:hypothetical protein
MKECMIEASACYRNAGDSKATTAKAMKKATSKASTKATYRGAPSSSSNPWIAHVQAYRASHGCSYAEAMQGAKKTYRGRHFAGCTNYNTTLSNGMMPDEPFRYDELLQFHAYKESGGGTWGFQPRDFTLYAKMQRQNFGSDNDVLVGYLLEYRKGKDCKGKFEIDHTDSTVNLLLRMVESNISRSLPVTDMDVAQLFNGSETVTFEDQRGLLNGRTDVVVRKKNFNVTSFMENIMTERSRARYGYPAIQ